MKTPAVEVLTTADCPSARETLKVTREVVHNLSPGIEVTSTVIDTADRAAIPGFRGSPTILVNGEDIEGPRGSTDGSCCRTYGDSRGVPPVWMIEAAVLRCLELRHYLFLCVANSVRSQMAEGIARSLAPSHVQISSAGSAPSYVNPGVIGILNEIGIDISRQKSKSVDGFIASTVDAVVTLCAEEVCPAFLSKTLRVHWALPDPAFRPTERGDRFEPFRSLRDELTLRLGLLFRQS